jgi:hypothetical protein
LLIRIKQSNLDRFRSLFQRPFLARSSRNARRKAACASITSRLAVDIGVFSGAKDHEIPLSLKKEKVTQETQTFEVVVDQMPSRAGIDPYNKLIDRIPEDNIIDVSKP